MAELADALDLGSSVFDVGVQVLFPAPVIYGLFLYVVKHWEQTVFIFAMLLYVTICYDKT